MGLNPPFLSPSAPTNSLHVPHSSFGPGPKLLPSRILLFALNLNIPLTFTPPHSLPPYVPHPHTFRAQTHPLTFFPVSTPLPFSTIRDYLPFTPHFRSLNPLLFSPPHCLHFSPPPTTLRPTIATFMSYSFASPSCSRSPLPPLQPPPPILNAFSHPCTLTPPLFPHLLTIPTPPPFLLFFLNRSHPPPPNSILHPYLRSTLPSPLLALLAFLPHPIIPSFNLLPPLMSRRDDIGLPRPGTTQTQER